MTPRIPEAARLVAIDAVSEMLTKRYGRTPSREYVEAVCDAALDAVSLYVWIISDTGSLVLDRRTE